MSAQYLAFSRVALVAIAANLICKAGAGANDATLSTGPTDKHLGTSVETDTAVGEMVDIALSSIGYVRLGAAVAAGDLITSDANAKGVSTTTAGHRYIGPALKAGVLNEVIPYLRSPGLI